MMFWTLLLGLAMAGPMESLERAADSELSEEQRMQSFNELVRRYEYNRLDLERVSSSADAIARQRWIAIRVMGMSGSPDAKQPLLELCDDPMPAIRAAAASALGDLGFRDTADRLGPMLEDPAIMVRASAATALGQLGAETSAKYLERALRDGSNYYRGQSLWVRSDYVRALGEIGSQSSIPALIACFDDKDVKVQAASLQALRAIVGYDFAEGRSEEEHKEAWRRWYASQD